MAISMGSTGPPLRISTTVSAAPNTTPSTASTMAGGMERSRSMQLRAFFPKRPAVSRPPSLRNTIRFPRTQRIRWRQDWTRLVGCSSKSSASPQ